MRNILAALFVCVSIGSVQASPSASSVCMDQATEVVRLMKNAEKLLADLNGIETDVQFVGDLIGGETGQAYVSLANSSFADQKNAARNYIDNAKTVLPLLLECATK